METGDMNALLRSRAALVSAFVVMALSVSMLGCIRPQGDSKEAREELNAAIGWCTGTAGRVDEDTARGLFEKAAGRGGPLATMWLARLYSLGHCGFPMDRVRAIDLGKSALKGVRKLADCGDIEAMFLLGFALSDNLDESASFSAGQSWSLKAAEGGHIVAQRDVGTDYWLAAMYAGNDARAAADYIQAVRWYRLAADQGDVHSIGQLGRAHFEGKGVRQDLSEAVRLIQAAADRGDRYAPWYLGSCFYSGEGVAANHTEALKWYELAASNGDAWAQYVAGWIYQNGDGVSENHKSAVRWLQLAADEGISEAQNALGIEYENGKGVPQDYVEATKWYRRAAERGIAVAQYNLGRMYWRGMGVPEDNQLAYAFFSLASAGGYEDAVVWRDMAKALLDDEQLGRAQAFATEFQRRVNVYRSSTPSDTTPDVSIGELTRSGSGFATAGGRWLLTNAHIVEECRAVKVVVSRKKVVGQVRAADSVNDLALVELNPPADGEVYLSSPGQLRLGAEVVVLGFPLQGLLSSSPHVTTGVVSSLAGPGDDSRLIQISAALQPGNSGGPVVDRSGNLIGVAVGKLDAILVARATGSIPENVGFAIRSDIVAAFLSSQGIKSRTSKSKSNLDVAEIGERARSYVARVECWN